MELKIEHLSKQFKDKTAVNDVNLTLTPGVWGLLGANGAGKTTLLNRILTEEHGQKIAVIENEFGEESIDNDLLVQSEDEEIITMNNGCICCTIRGDLAENLIRLMERKKEGKANFDRVIIETTGLADPGPVAQTFFMLSLIHI